MKAGRLNKRIVLQEKSATQNTYGEEVVTWQDLATVWAEVRPSIGAESFKENQYQGSDFVTFRVRFSNATRLLTVQHRISFEGRTFDIASVTEIGFREGVEINAFTRSEKALSNLPFGAG